MIRFNQQTARENARPDEPERIAIARRVYTRGEATLVDRPGMTYDSRDFEGLLASGSTPPDDASRRCSFVVRTQNMSTREAEALVEEQAEAFERHKDYLIERWDSGETWSKQVEEEINLL